MYEIGKVFSDRKKVRGIKKMKDILPMDKLDQRHRGLSRAVADAYVEAARVCLDRHHESPQEFIINNDHSTTAVVVQWEKPDERSNAAWANTDDATRDGAYACALAATELTKGLVAVHRAERLTGADYYLAPEGKSIEDLEDCIRLEVSGTHSDDTLLKSRLRTKVKQTKNGISDLPAMAAVVGFKVRKILIETVG